MLVCDKDSFVFFHTDDFAGLDSVWGLCQDRVAGGADSAAVWVQYGTSSLEVEGRGSQGRYVCGGPSRRQEGIWTEVFASSQGVESTIVIDIGHFAGAAYPICVLASMHIHIHSYDACTHAHMHICIHTPTVLIINYYLVGIDDKSFVISITCSLLIFCKLLMLSPKLLNANYISS